MVEYLILWDVDNTLVRHQNIGRGLFEGLIEELAKTYTDPRLRNRATMPSAIEKGISMLGYPGARLLMEFYKELGFSEQEVKRERLIEVAFDIIPEITSRMIMHPESNTKIMDGVEMIVRAIKNDDRFIQGLQTCNVRRGAAVKLGHVGLLDYFPKYIGGYPLGGYSDDLIERKRGLPYPLTRTELITSARKKVAQYAGLEFPNRQVIVVGDSEGDLIASQESGVTSIIVPQHSTSLEKLASKAHHVFRSYPMPEQFLQEVIEATKK